MKLKFLRSDRQGRGVEETFGERDIQRQHEAAAKETIEVRMFMPTMILHRGPIAPYAEFRGILNLSSASNKAARCHQVHVRVESQAGTLKGWVCGLGPIKPPDHLGPAWRLQSQAPVNWMTSILHHMHPLS